MLLGFLAGGCCSNDMRDVLEKASHGEEEALLAAEVFAHKCREHVAGYLATVTYLAKGGEDEEHCVNCIVFSAGIGENSAWMRWKICQGLGPLGVVLDSAKNDACRCHDGVIAEIHDAKKSRIPVLVIHTDEDAEMGAQVVECLSQET